MATIPKSLQPHINSAFPEHVCLVGSCCRTATRRSRRAAAPWSMTTSNRPVGARQGLHHRQPARRQQGDGVFSQAAIARRRRAAGGGIARFYGTAKIHKSGAVYDKVWRRLVQPEKDRDPDKKGFAVLIKVERAEDLNGAPLKLE